MKTSFITQFCLALLCCLAVSFSQAQSTTVKLGKLQNGIASITDQRVATNFLVSNLPAGSAVSDIKVEYAAGEQKYYLTAKVSNNEISSVGFQLTLDNAGILAFSGPGVEVSCIGYKCSSCRLNFAGLKPFCQCFDSNPSTDSRCDMTSKVVIGF